MPCPCRSFPFDLHSAAVFDSHIPWHGLCESALCVNQTRPHCVNQMGKTQSTPLAERHGRGTAEERHGNGMVCVNPPSISVPLKTVPRTTLGTRAVCCRRLHYCIWAHCSIHRPAVTFSVCNPSYCTSR
jgi:hypothetical protein